MNFCDKLNEYMSDLDCSSQELVELSGLSSAVISRYRKGDRTPSIRSKQLKDLVGGLHKASIKKGKNIEEEEIYKSFANVLNDILIDFDELSKNFNELISAFNISIADLSRFIGYDASFVSKIRTGRRKPSKPQEFVKSVSNFVATKYKTEENKKTASILMGCNIDELDTHSKYASKINSWLSTNSTPAENYINNFLNNLDNFNLNEYIKAIHFDELKIPFVPFYKSSSRTYYGIEEMKRGELDFFKATVLGKSLEPVFMCSDMPMEDMAEDIDFGKKWMFAIAMMLKKGLHLNMIHNLDRPFNEMMLGLESWIPIYMTGQVSPYYLKGFKDTVYNHMNYVSGSVALTGECIAGNHNGGKYYLTSSKSELKYYKEKSDALLKKATSLMDIYKVDSKNTYKLFLENNFKTNSNYRRILYSLPIHTISEDLLLDILKKNKLSETEIKDILSSVKEQKRLINELLKSGTLEDDIHELSKEEFENHTLSLALADSFFEKSVKYTYDDYINHLNQTKDYSKKHKNYSVKSSNIRTFKNIQVTIHENKWVMISKSNSPSIHFVIYHPKLREAIENFIPPIVE